MWVLFQFFSDNYLNSKTNQPHSQGLLTSSFGLLTVHTTWWPRKESDHYFAFPAMTRKLQGDLELPMWMFQYIVTKAMRIPPAEWLQLKHTVNTRRSSQASIVEWCTTTDIPDFWCGGIAMQDPLCNIQLSIPAWEQEHNSSEYVHRWYTVLVAGDTQHVQCTT